MQTILYCSLIFYVLLINYYYGHKYGMIFRNMEAVNEIVNQTKDASTIQKANRYNVICGLLRGLYRGQGYGPVSYNRKRLPKPRTATKTAKLSMMSLLHSVGRGSRLR